MTRTEKAEETLTGIVRALVRAEDEANMSPDYHTEPTPLGPTPVEPFEAADIAPDPDRRPWQIKAAEKARKIERRLRSRERVFKLWDRLGRLRLVVKDEEGPTP